MTVQSDSAILQAARLEAGDADLRRRFGAVIALVAATALWGCAFTWAKAGGAGINRAAGLAAGAALGPVLFLSWRFLAAGVVWLALFPASRRAWASSTVRRGLALGLILWLSMNLQMLGLDRTSAAVSAFLTSLTVVFVPLAIAIFLRRLPKLKMWTSVALAVAGIYMMTGAAPTGFGVGELLGLGCALGFSVHLILIGEYVPRDNPFRMAVAQFVIVGVLGLASCALLEGGMLAYSPGAVLKILNGGHESFTFNLSGVFSGQVVWINLLLVTTFSTLGAFGLMIYFQPRLSAPHAALIYLCEPIFAAIYAYLAAGSPLSGIAVAGAALILTANVLHVVGPKRGRPPSEAPQPFTASG